MLHEETIKVVDFILASPLADYSSAYTRALKISYKENWKNHVVQQWTSADVVEAILTSFEVDPLIRTYKLAKEIIESNKWWEEKYGLIFSEKISKKFSLNYCDPDTDYKDDVLAW